MEGEKTRVRGMVDAGRCDIGCIGQLGSGFPPDEVRGLFGRKVKSQRVLLVPEWGSPCPAATAAQPRLMRSVGLI